MKKSLFTAFCASILLSCNQSTNNSESQSKETASAVGDTSMTLNNGAKWKTDSMTTHNLVRLKVTANMFRTEPFPSQSNYQILGSDLANDAYKMLQENKMENAGQDALHKWLTPITTQSERLKNITDTAEGRKIFDSVDRRINTFQQFFD